MTRSAFVWALLTLVLLGPGEGASQTTPGSDTIQAGVVEDWPPVYTTDDQGRPAGFGMDVMAEVARRAGLEVRYRSFESFPLAMEALAESRIDVIPNVGDVQFRREEMGLRFTSPYETHSILLFVRSSTPGVHVPEDLAGGRVGVVDGNVGVELAEALPSIRSVSYASVRRALFALLSGEVEGLIYPEAVIRHLAEAADVQDMIRPVGGALREVQRGIAVSPSRAEDLLPRLEAALAEFRDTPAFQEVFTRWHTPPPPLLTPGRLAALSGALLLVVLLGMGFWRHVSVLRLNRRLQREESRFRSLVEGLAEGIMIADLGEGRIQYVNRRCCEMLGYDEASDLEGTRAADLLPSDAERERLVARLEDRARGIRDSYEVQLCRADGSTLWVEVHATPYRVDGELVGSLAALTDISDRKRAQRDLAERNRYLAQKQRLEAVGRLAGGIAHDFNNLLTTISAIASLLVEDVEPDHPWMTDLRSILHSTERAAALTRQLLVFSRERPPEVEILDPAQVLRDTEALLRRTLGEDILLRTELAEGRFRVKMDRSQFEQVIINLVVNARDAMPEGGELLLALEGGARPEDPDLGGPEVPDWIQIRVRDSGMGMSAETRSRIFEPFFTTKPTGEGSGMGLSTVYGIVKTAGGEIQVDSEPGAGTEFRVILPRHPR